MAFAVYSNLFCYFYLLVIGTRGDNTNWCKNNTCVLKCCPESEYLANASCLRYNSTTMPDFSSVTVYDHSLKKLNDSVKFVNDENKERLLGELEMIDLTYFKVFIIKDGSLRVIVDLPNVEPRTNVVKENSYCVDYTEVDSQLELRIWFQNESNEEELESSETYTFNAVALIISSLFLVLVLIVYILLDEMRNMPGKTVMSIVASLLGSFTMLAAQLLHHVMEINPPKEFCFASTFLIYMFSLSSWCWMNVMSFNAWRSFRNFIKPKNRRARFFERTYLWYSCYAWGVPLIMAVMLIVVDLSDLTSTPHILKPNIGINGCYLEGKAQFLYQYVPMLIIILCNWVFFLLTAWNLWQTRKQVKAVDNARPSSSQPREGFFVCLKLSLITGASYIFEIMGYVAPQYKAVWYVPDAYNMLAGVLIFIVFVCKERTISLLRQKLKLWRRKDINVTSKACTSTTLS